MLVNFISSLSKLYTSICVANVFYAYDERNAAARGNARGNIRQTCTYIYVPLFELDRGSSIVFVSTSSSRDDLVPRVCDRK